MLTSLCCAGVIKGIYVNRYFEPKIAKLHWNPRVLVISQKQKYDGTN